MAAQPQPWSDEEQKAGQAATAAWETHFQTVVKGAVERHEEIRETSRITETQSHHEANLLRLPNVVGVAPTFKVTDGTPTRKWALAVLVEKKVAKGDLPREAVVPAQLDGVVTDVIEVGRPEALVFNARVRPALPGFSIGHHNITAGTFGCLVRDIRRCCCRMEKECGCGPGREECPGDYLILSNNHVLANSNAGKPGDLILQPGPFDGGVYPSDAIATLERFEPITFGMTGYNLVDAAVARPTFTRNVAAAIVGVLMPRGIDQAFIVGSPVIKVGRTTQVTVGRILATNATVAVNYGIGVAVYRHQILTTAMSAGGDSGSLLMDANLNAVGLLFAGSPVITIHNHIADVETALGVRPLTAPRPS
jgi:hypothetical protein